MHPTARLHKQTSSNKKLTRRVSKHIRERGIREKSYKIFFSVLD